MTKKVEEQPEEEVIEVEELEAQVCERCAELEAQVQQLQWMLQNIHADPDMQLAVLDAIRSMVVDGLRQKYLRAGTQQR